jgi:hypothetical protein
VTHKPKWGLGDNYPEQVDPALHCIGLTQGVVVLANSMYPEYSDQFLVSHEMGHSRFLHHHETGQHKQPDPNHVNDDSDNPDDHDLRDHNCTMCYPFGVPSRPGLTWQPAGIEKSAFCGKCILKLRGWDIVHNILPRQS